MNEERKIKLLMTEAGREAASDDLVERIWTDIQQERVSDFKYEPVVSPALVRFLALTTIVYLAYVIYLTPSQDSTISLWPEALKGFDDSQLSFWYEGMTNIEFNPIYGYALLALAVSSILLGKLEQIKLTS